MVHKTFKKPMLRLFRYAGAVLKSFLVGPPFKVTVLPEAGGTKIQNVVGSVDLK